MQDGGLTTQLGPQLQGTELALLDTGMCGGELLVGVVSGGGELLNTTALLLQLLRQTLLLVNDQQGESFELGQFLLQGRDFSSALLLLSLLVFFVLCNQQFESVLLGSVLNIRRE